MEEKIPHEIAEKFHLPDVSDYPFGEAEYYKIFLIQSDYEITKFSETLLSVSSVVELLDVIVRAAKEFGELAKWRAIARGRVRELENT